VPSLWRLYVCVWVKSLKGNQNGALEVNYSNYYIFMEVQNTLHTINVQQFVSTAWLQLVSQSVDLSGWECAFHVPLNAAVNCNLKPLLVGTRHQKPCRRICQMQPLTPLTVSMCTIAYVQRGRRTQQVGWMALGHRDIILTSSVPWIVELLTLPT